MLSSLVRNVVKRTGVRMVNTITVPAACDFHLHLRQGDLMKLVTPEVEKGGVSLAYIMPNLKPVVANTEQALAYKAELQQLAPNVTFLMTLYLSPELNPEEIRKAAKAGVKGVKSYPRGVTTNSDSGIESYTAYYPVFKAMEEEGLVLNLHGEVPSDAEKNICVMNAEETFLSHLKELHKAFPKLRIVLEHATTKAAVDMVKSLGDTVGCTITVHHLSLTVDDWAGQAHHFCKPVAKYPQDRAALRQVIKEGHPRFFLGTDSAPHPKHLKECAQACAGVYTSSHVLPYVATILESFGALDNLSKFTSENGLRFYGITEKEYKGTTVQLEKVSDIVPQSLPYQLSTENATYEIVPFMAGKELAWKIVA